jgi:Tfp pilus assembly protein PilV
MRTNKSGMYSRFCHDGRAGRRGMTIFEVAVSAVVLGAAVTTAAQLVQWSVSLHQVALKKRCALEAATTVLDRLSTQPWSAITPESAKNTALPAEVKNFLHDPQLTVSVAEEKANLPRGKRIAVEISWAKRDGKHTQRVQLTTWVFRSGNDR